MQFFVKVKGEGQSSTEFSAFSSSCCVNWVSKSTKKKKKKRLDTTSDLGGSVGGRSVREDFHSPTPLPALPLRSPPPRHAEELLIAAGEEKDHKRETGVKKKNHASGERKRGEERGREKGEKKRGEGRGGEEKRGEERRKEKRGGEERRREGTGGEV